MPTIYMNPVVGPGFLRAPGGVVGGHPISLNTYRINSSVATPKIVLGSTGTDPLTGNMYMFVQAGGAVPINSAVTFTSTGNTVVATSASQQLVPGVADAAFNLNDFGWIMTDGTATVLAAGGTASGNLLVSGGTAGTLQLALATDLATRGICAITAVAGGTVSAYFC